MGMEGTQQLHQDSSSVQLYPHLWYLYRGGAWREGIHEKATLQHMSHLGRGGGGGGGILGTKAPLFSTHYCTHLSSSSKCTHTPLSNKKVRLCERHPKVACSVSMTTAAGASRYTCTRYTGYHTHPHRCTPIQAHTQ